jgi:hypothetical protein
MLATHPTAVDASRQDAFRWSRTDRVTALDHFAAAEPCSQRACAEQLGIPHATFHYWLQRYAPAADDPVDTFFRSAAGESVLRHILAAALLVFQQRGACGLRLLGAFLELAQLDRFVACSRGALHPLAVQMESALVAFRDEQQPLLAQQMKPQTITVVADEHFHSVHTCLVALEPVSNFLLVECYRDRRDADTWTEAIQEGTHGMSVEIVQLTSDQARGLLCCAEKGLQVAHSGDLFHGQRDLLQPLLLPLLRPIQQAEKDLQKAQQHSAQLDTPLQEPQSEEEFLALVQAVRQEVSIAEQLQQAQQRKDEAVQQVRGVGDDYHPFDRHTGQPVRAAEVGQRLDAHLDQLAEVVQQAGLGVKATAAVTKARTWVGKLMGCVAWFWCLAQARLEEWELSAEQEQLVKEKLLPGHYWDRAARRARTAAERKRLKELAEGLKKEAWQAAALASLPDEDKKRIEAVAQTSAGLFQRSSSCVEGRNGRLSLQHHAQSRVRERRLQALTVIHNYVVQDADRTTAAERFFGCKHQDVFAWLLERMPDLPRPARKRSTAATDGLPVARSAG